MIERMELIKIYDYKGNFIGLENFKVLETLLDKNGEMKKINKKQLILAIISAYAIGIGTTSIVSLIGGTESINAFLVLGAEPKVSMSLKSLMKATLSAVAFLQVKKL